MVALQVIRVPAFVVLVGVRLHAVLSSLLTLVIDTFAFTPAPVARTILKPELFLLLLLIPSLLLLLLSLLLLNGDSDGKIRLNMMKVAVDRVSM
jgi:hypothetical protein